jgi:hypothetical protein
MPKATFEIETGANPDGLSFRVRDEPSGMTLASFRLDSNEIWQLLRGGHITIDGEVTSQFGRVGKTMISEVFAVPKDGLTDIDFSDRQAYGEAWAEANLSGQGWEQFTASRTNSGGVKVVARKWVDQ